MAGQNNNEYFIFIIETTRIYEYIVKNTLQTIVTNLYEKLVIHKIHVYYTSYVNKDKIPLYFLPLKLHEFIDLTVKIAYNSTDA